MAWNGMRRRLQEVAAYAGAWLMRRPVPLNLTFEITHRCNLRCRYCDRNERKPNELDTGVIIDAITEFHRLGTRIMSLDGGEPLTHPDFPAIVEHIRSLGILLKINSNGLRVPKLIDWVKCAYRLKISLDGNERNHDRMRGAGSFRKTLRGIDVARSHGVDVELTCVLHRGNLDSVFELLALARKLETPIIFQPARDSLVGGANRDSSAWMPDYSELHDVFRMMSKIRGTESIIGNRNGSLKHFLQFPNDADLPCAAGWVNCTVDPEGNLYHCGMISRDAYHNSILAVGVRAAWERLERWGCPQCWCARVVEENLAWGLRFRDLLS